MLVPLTAPKVDGAVALFGRRNRPKTLAMFVPLPDAGVTDAVNVMSTPGGRIGRRRRDRHRRLRLAPR